MADKVKVELGGKSKYDVAYTMANDILFSFEKKQTATREEFLKTVWECIHVLDGNHP